MPKRTRDYEESLIEALKDPDEAAAYLNAHLQREPGDTDELLLLALRNVAKAHGFGELAERTDLSRESLYRALSADGNPTLSTLTALLNAMGLRISVEVQDRGRKRTSSDAHAAHR